ncbi:alpha/beta hydrolase [Engelhardtia mirabilis]|uniref:Alpha/beta hydrolase family protein n=1 Tax=Engelhardtia mirabilis TaxID=2528011 RepID=A0A518BJ59_9BACT|nr:Alpha/beta hydrolase family protein [Planctomycetes bacterium Pla133]QDV01310.1 Alpha/beta hydrolase family protein [Planctomycetes bacterium Pla86]
MLTSSLLVAALSGPLLPVQVEFPSACATTTSHSIPAGPSIAVGPPIVARPLAQRGRTGLEPVALRTSDKIALKGDFYAPREDDRRAPAVLLIHGAGSDRSTLTDMAEGLQRANFAVLTLDLRGHGESVAENLDWSDMDAEARKTLWAFATRDVDTAARWLSQHEGIHSTNLTVIGVGAGGALAVRHAAHDENVRCVGIVGLESELYGFDLTSDLRDVEGLPVMIVAGRDQRDAADELVEEVEGDGYISIVGVRSEGAEVLTDKKLRKDVSDWVEAQAMPKRGGRS